MSSLRAAGIPAEQDTDRPATRLRRLIGSNRARRAVGTTLLILAGAATSIAVALLVTPMQQVSAGGQTVQVGVAAPSFSLSGPGELDLFGQQIPTTTTFAGPVRPRLRLTHITLSKQLAQLTGDSSGELENALVRGFRHYFFWQLTVVAAVAVLLFGAISGWRRRGRRGTVLLVGLGLVVTEAINLGAIMFTGYTAPGKLRQVHSLQALVGGAPTLPTPTSRGSSTPPDNQHGRRVVVVGDSTAAGLGNQPLSDPSPEERACHRSADSYALDLARASGSPVISVACSGATVASGLVGPQSAGGTTLPAQLGTPAVSEADTIIVSIGANDVKWSDLLRACAVSTNCGNNAEQAYFQKHLATFSSNYLQMLSDLQQLPHHPQVLVNLYYNPFSSDDSCLTSVHITSSKLRSVLSRLAALNSVLSQGAQTAGFATALPDFTGHGLCSKEPYVQGLQAGAPFHPTAAGELAIALTDEHALSVDAGSNEPGSR